MAVPSIMYAIIKACGRQYKVSEGDILFLEKMNYGIDDTITFEDVVFVSNDQNFVIGSPTIEGAKVVAKVLKNGKSKKITVFTYKPKKNYKRKIGHRQQYTKVQIESIKVS